MSALTVESLWQILQLRDKQNPGPQKPGFYLQQNGEGWVKSFKPSSLDTALSLTQTKNSLFKKFQQMDSVKNKQAIDLPREKRI